MASRRRDLRRTTWNLYLDGALDTSLAVAGSPVPRSDSIQHAGLGTALNSTGGHEGYFQGTVDEARVWSVVRTLVDIQTTKDLEITSGQGGLSGVWNLNEGVSNVVSDSSGNGNTGAAVGSPTWVAGFAVPGTPVALADSYTTPQDAALNVSAPGVLANDTDNGPITAVLVTNVTHGSLTLNADGGFGYTPNAGYVGPDSFTYKANDGSLDSDPVAVSIGVGNSALQFDGTNDYVTFGAAPHREMPRVRNGRFVIVPATKQSDGEGNNTVAGLWRHYLAEVLNSSAH